MIYTKSQIIQDVRLVLDENVTSVQLNNLLDTETLDLNDIIVDTICDAARAVESGAPLHMLDCTKELTADITIVGNTKFLVDLPTDFMRMVDVRWTKLDRPIYKFISVDSPEYIVQQNKYAQGTKERPVAAIVMGKNNHVLEIYADGVMIEVGGKDNVYIGEYLPLPKFVDDTLELCERCYKSIIYRCAGMALVIYQDGNADNLLKISESLMI